MVRSLFLGVAFILNLAMLGARAEQSVYCRDAGTGRWHPCGTTMNNLGPLAGNGLPANAEDINDETLYYALDPGTTRFVPVAKWDEKRNLFYVRYDFRARRWIWVTGGDPRAVVAGSKVQGWRVGVTMADRRGLNWFRLERKETVWQKVTDRQHPEVYRREFNGQVVLGERYPDDWARLGGVLDPLPSEEPKCRLTINPPQVTVRQPIQIHVSIEGAVTSAFLDGQTIHIVREAGRQFADIPRLPQSPGFFTAMARVVGPGGEGTCEANYTVLPERRTFL